MPWSNRMSTVWYKSDGEPGISVKKLAWGVAAGLGGLSYLKLWLPATGLAIPCLFREVTGHYCPGCGMTRACLALLELDPGQAFRYNPLLFILAPMFAAYAWTNRKRMKRTGAVIMGMMLVITVGFGIMRNLPGFEAWAPAGPA